MYLSGLDEIDRKMLDLLTQNARYTYSELGERLGLSRVAIKNRMDALEQRGVIEGYTVIVNPQRLGSAVSCYYEIETRPEALPHVIAALQDCPSITQIYRVTGRVPPACARCGRQPGGAGNADARGAGSAFRVERIESSVILSRVKDVKGLRL